MPREAPFFTKRLALKQIVNKLVRCHFGLRKWIRKRSNLTKTVLTNPLGKCCLWARKRRSRASESMLGLWAGAQKQALRVDPKSSTCGRHVGVILLPFFVLESMLDQTNKTCFLSVAEKRTNPKTAPKRTRNYGFLASLSDTKSVRAPKSDPNRKGPQNVSKRCQNAVGFP